MKNIKSVLYCGIIFLILGSLAGANTVFSNQKTWPPILNIDVTNLKAEMVWIDLDSMNASLVANDFESLEGPMFGYGYASSVKAAPHNRINFGFYTTSLAKSTAKGVKKVNFSLQTVGLRGYRDFGTKSFTFSPNAGFGVSFANLALRHNNSEDIYAEPREVLAKGYYLNGSLGANVNYNINEIFALSASAEFFGGYKLFKPIKDFDSYTGLRLGIGVVVSLPL